MSIKIASLKKSSRKREYNKCTQKLRDLIIYNYLFYGKSNRWLDQNIIGEDSSYSKGYTSMGVLHYLGLNKKHKGIFNNYEVEDAIAILKYNGEEFNEVAQSLIRFNAGICTYNNLDSFKVHVDSPFIIKQVGTSQYSDGVRINKEYHDIFNPPESEYYAVRGTARQISILFNNKVFDAEYRYEGQKDKSKQMQSIRFRKELKEEFKKLFPNPFGFFTIQIGQDLNHFIFNKYTEDELELGEKAYSEGRSKYRLHRTRERNPILIKKAKELFKQKHGYLFCEVCGFDFSKAYGDRGKDFIEGHHNKRISDLKNGEKTKVRDISMLCSNCHRMIHRSPFITLDELKNLINKP